MKNLFITFKILCLGLTLSSNAFALDCDFTNLIGGKILLNFGLYNPLEANALQISTDINFECGPDIIFVAPYTINLTITGGTTQNGVRVIPGPLGKNLKFIIASDQQCLNEIRNNIVFFARTDQFPRKRNYRVSIFGCVFPGQDVAVGQYMSNLRVVISTRIGR